jgi:hypothetical protein
MVMGLILGMRVNGIERHQNSARRRAAQAHVPAGGAASMRGPADDPI